jgi:mono/diheme cytochrome c family protein
VASGSGLVRSFFIGDCRIGTGLVPISAEKGKLGMIRVAAAAFAAMLAACAMARAQTQTPVERGGYLINTIMTCNNCHTPIGPGGPDFTKALSGGSALFDGPAFTVRAANITPDPETGIGKWSADEIKSTLATGARPNGVRLAAVMPTHFYKVITARDLDAIAAYLKSINPVRNAVQPPVYKIALAPEQVPGAGSQMTEADFTDPIKHGFYLATIGHCMECHTPLVQGHHDFANSLGKGGQEFKGPWGVTVSRNLTSSRTAGLGAWTDAEIKRAITQGVDKDGNRLKPPMGFGYYAHMTDADLGDVIAWLRTLPAKD